MIKKSTILLVVLLTFFHLGSSVAAESDTNNESTVTDRKTKEVTGEKLNPANSDMHDSSDFVERKDPKGIKEDIKANENLFMSYQIGDYGQHIVQLKRDLSSLGYGSFSKSPTPDYEIKIETVVKEFQLDHQLKESGIADENTLGKIEEVVSKYNQEFSGVESDTSGESNRADELGSNGLEDSQFVDGKHEFLDEDKPDTTEDTESGSNKEVEKPNEPKDGTKSSASEDDKVAEKGKSETFKGQVKRDKERLGTLKNAEMAETIEVPKSSEVEAKEKKPVLSDSYLKLNTSSKAVLLKEGTRHKKVIDLKKDLNKLGYSGITVTNYFGSFTEKRVKEFQKYYGLKATGEVDKATLSKISSLLPNPLSKGKRHKDTIKLKKNLNSLGYGGITVTNYYGAFTEKRVKEFQMDYGLPASGIADAKTLAAIDKAMESGEKVSYTQYGLTLSEATAIQITATPQTDLYKQYVSSSYIELRNGSYYVTADALNVRGGPGTNYGVVDTLYKGQQVSVRGKEGDWYRLYWVDAKKADIQYYLDPYNFINDERQKFQFLDLSQSSGATRNVLNNYLKGKGILAGQGQGFIDASHANGVNDVYLISHAILETGNGSSKLAKGVKYNGVTVYNMYGIGAYDSCAIECGAKKAYEEGWTTPYKAIVGGSKFIGTSYIKSGQNTIYKMRWNPVAMASTGRYGKQYATDIGWASKQISTMYNLYQQLGSYSLYLDVPEYKR